MTLIAAVEPIDRSKPSTMRVNVTPRAKIPTMVIPRRIENILDQLQNTGSANPNPKNEPAMTIKKPYLIANDTNLSNLNPLLLCNQAKKLVSIYFRSIHLS